MAFQEIYDDLASYDNTPQGRGVDLRLDLAKILLDGIVERRWTKAKLAQAAGMKPSQLTPLLKGERNFTSEVAGRLAFALGQRFCLITRPAETTKGETFDTTVSNAVITTEELTNGKAEIPIYDKSCS